MSEIAAVLVVPAEGDPGGLLAMGRFPCWPPVAMRHHGTGAWMTTMSGDPEACRAVPLWWDGKLVPEGWDRTVRQVERHEWSQGRLSSHPPDEWCRRYPEVEDVEIAARDLVVRGLASRVVRLTRDGSGRLVES